VEVVLCSQYFHDVQITGLKPGSTYYYQIPGSNGTTTSDVLSFKTARAVGDSGSFSIAVLNDMGYTNARGTHKQLAKAANDDVAFAWHGGDISYADDWADGTMSCELTGPDSYPLCYNGTDTTLPNTPPAPRPKEYNTPLPKGEIPNQGGPNGGDISVIYESNWDLWQQWQNEVTTKVPYMVLPGNHEAACSEGDGPGNLLTSYLNNNQTNTTAPEAGLTYYSCPPSQRNFTTFQHRFRMPGKESGGVGNFWYSFDYGMAHFVSLDGETDFAKSPESPFLRDTNGNGDKPTENQTYVTNSGPFGTIDNNQYLNNSAYQQIQWLKQDLARVDRKKTPWVIAMSHRPMYSTEVAAYQANIRNAFEAILLDAGVDMYLAGHIHWYERNWPLTLNGTVDRAAIIDNNTYAVNPGKSLVHITNGMAGNIESHSFIKDGTPIRDTTAVLNQLDYGFSKLTFKDVNTLTWEFVKGDGSGIGDSLTLRKKSSSSAAAPASYRGRESGPAIWQWPWGGRRNWMM
jgi:acid phosphatase